MHGMHSMPPQPPHMAHGAQQRHGHSLKRSYDDCQSAGGGSTSGAMRVGAVGGEALDALEEALQGGGMLQKGDALQPDATLERLDKEGALDEPSSVSDAADLASKFSRGDLLRLLGSETGGLAMSAESVASELSSLDGAATAEELELDGVLNVLEKWEKNEKPDCKCQ